MRNQKLSRKKQTTSLVAIPELNHSARAISIPPVSSLSVGKIRWASHLLDQVKRETIPSIQYELGKFISTLETVQSMEAKVAVEREIGLRYYERILTLIRELSDCLRKE